MRGALSLSPSPSPTSSPDPEGPIQPLDIEDIEEFDDLIGEFENGDVRVDEDGLTVTTEIEGIPVEFRLTEDGLQIEPSER